METNQIKFPPKTFQNHTISDHLKNYGWLNECISIPYHDNRKPSLIYLTT